MITEVWIDNVDGHEAENLKWTKPEDSGPIVIPQIGEKVGYRLVDPDIPNAYNLDFVVDVRHYFFMRDDEWVQEIHIMTSEGR